MAVSSASTAIAHILADPRIWKGDGLGRASLRTLGSGFAILDRELPGAGWPLAAITEIISPQSGSGVFSLLRCVIAAEAAAGRQILLIAPPFVPYAPAWMAAGIRLDRLTWINPANEQEKLWSMEQALREPACVVLGWHRQRLHDRSARRLQLAAEAGGSCNFLIRLEQDYELQSPLALRLGVAPAPGGLQVRVLKRRGSPLSSALFLPLSGPSMENPLHAISGPVFPAPGAGARFSAPLGLV